MIYDEIMKLLEEITMEMLTLSNITNMSIIAETTFVPCIIFRYADDSTSS